MCLDGSNRRGVYFSHRRDKMKKILIPVIAAFVAVSVMFTVYQIKNPPSPEVATSYTQGKVELLLYNYAADETTVDDTEFEIYGVMIEEAVKRDGVTCEYVYFDKNGVRHKASSNGEHTQSEGENGELLKLAGEVGTNGFTIPTNYDFDTAERDEVKIYLNTSSGVRLLTLTHDGFEQSVYARIRSEFDNETSK